MSNRGTGRTTEQIVNAPHRAVFVWCNTHLHYPRDLTRKMGREDLRIEPITSLGRFYDRLRGLTPEQLVFDHAVADHASEDEYRNMLILTRGR